MKLSQYVVTVPNYPDADHCTLFSTLTRAIIQVPASLYESIRAGQCTPARPELQILRRSGIVVDDTVDERLVYRLWSCRNRYDSTKTSLTLVMGYACNCACKYCYEVGVRQVTSGELMPADVSPKILSWIRNYLDVRETRHLDLCFHGGEPLLNLREIERIGPEVRRACQLKGVTCFLSVVTNGTLLTPAYTDRLVNAGVEFAMITLDGPQPVHDERRPYLSGRGTFRIVLKHIAQAADKLKIYVLMNVDRHNCASAEDLANALVSKGLQDKLYGVYVAFVEPTKPATDHCRMYDMPRDELARHNVSINRIFIEHGFKVRELVQLGFCTMNSDNSFIFDSRGDVYKCITGVGDEHFKIGSVDDDLNILTIKASQFIENEPCDHNPDCEDCTFLPMCRGGCRHESYVRYGDMTTGVCMRDYYEAWIPAVVKEIYKYAIAPGTSNGKGPWVDTL